MREGRHEDSAETAQIRKRTIDGLRRRIEALPRSAWLREPATFSLHALSAGAYHDNFLLECAGVRSVVRVNRESQWGLASGAQLEKEFAVLEDLASTGVAPLPLILVPGAPPFMIESYIEAGPFLYGDDLAAAAVTVSRVHRTPPRRSRVVVPHAPAETFLVEDGLRWLAMAEGAGANGSALRMLSGEAVRLRACPPTHTGPPVLIHTDLIWTNLLRAADGCRIVDWEGARLGPAAWDLAYFLSPVTRRWAPGGAGRLSVAERLAFLRSYADETGAELDDVVVGVEALLPFVVFRALAWCVGFEASSGPRGPAADQLSRFTDPEAVAGLLELALHLR